MNFQLAKTARGMVAGFALACAVSSAAMAQDISESHFAAARAALSAIKATDVYDNILPAAAESLKARLIANNIDLEAEISQVVDEQAFALVSRRADLENEAARVYAIEQILRQYGAAIQDVQQQNNLQVILDRDAVVTAQPDSPQTAAFRKVAQALVAQGVA